MDIIHGEGWKVEAEVVWCIVMHVVDIMQGEGPEG
jgi:hypothetical protein